jgi:YHS domain-containing protein
MDPDPVCGMHVDPESSNWVAEHVGKDYFFCSEACQHAFASDPENFVGVGKEVQGHRTQMVSMGGCCGVGRENSWRGYINTAIILILILLLIFR